MGKKKKLSPDLDLRPLLTKAMDAYELRIISQAIEKAAPGEEFDADALVISRDEVKGCTTGIYTVRYRGEIIMRRFPADLLRTKFHYESPIFND